MPPQTMIASVEVKGHPGRFRIHIPQAIYQGLDLEQGDMVEVKIKKITERKRQK